MSYATDDRINTCHDTTCDQCGAVVGDCCGHCPHYRDQRAQDV